MRKSKLGHGDILNNYPWHRGLGHGGRQLGMRLGPARRSESMAVKTAPYVGPADAGTTCPDACAPLRNDLAPNLLAEENVFTWEIVFTHAESTDLTPDQAICSLTRPIRGQTVCSVSPPAAVSESENG